MSFGASAVVFHHSQAKHTDLLVLYAVANFIGDDGAWPSIETIAHYARCDQTTASKALSRLEKMGEISRIKQAGAGKGVYKTNRYFLLLTCPADCSGDWNHTRQSDTSRGGNLPPLEMAKSIDKPVIEQVKETNVVQSATDQRFTEFWEIYPHRPADNKKKAKQYFDKLKPADQQAAITGAKRYAQTDLPADRKFIPMASTWLSQERWNDLEQPVIKVEEEIEWG